MVKRNTVAIFVNNVGKALSTYYSSTLFNSSICIVGSEEHDIYLNFLITWFWFAQP